MANRIWIDVEDLFKYLKLGQRPSGIQRLEFELCRAFYVLALSKGRMFFVRHDPERGLLVGIRSIGRVRQIHSCESWGQI